MAQRREATGQWLTNKETGAHFNTAWLDKEYDEKEKQIAENKKKADELNNKREAFRASREVDKMGSDGVLDRKSLKKGAQYTFDWKNKDGSTKTVTGEFVRTEMGNGDPVSIFKGKDGKNYALYDMHMKGVKPIGELGGMGIHDTRMKQTKKALAGGLNDLKSAPIGDLKELALDAGMTSSQINGMSKEDLRRAILAIYKKG